MNKFKLRNLNSLPTDDAVCLVQTRVRTHIYAKYKTKMLVGTIPGNGIRGDFYLHLVCLSLADILQFMESAWVTNSEQRNSILANGLNLTIRGRQAFLAPSQGIQPGRVSRIVSLNGQQPLGIILL